MRWPAVVVFLILVSIAYNRHFGNNAFPKNDHEMICDMIFWFMCLYAYLELSRPSVKSV